MAGGGWRQRVVQERDARPPSRSRSRSRSPRGLGKTQASLRCNKSSRLALSLLRDWTWGVQGSLFAPQVQRYAHDAIRDGCRHPFLQRLSRLGASGLSPQNIHPQLMHMFKNSAASTVVIPVENCCVQWMIPPHALFRALFDASIAKFKIRLGANKLNLLRFWKSFVRPLMGWNIVVSTPTCATKLPRTWPPPSLFIPTMMGDLAANCIPHMC